MRQHHRAVHGGFPAALAACVLLGAGLVAGCQQESPRAPSSEGPTSAASPEGATAAASPAAPAGGASATSSPAGAPGGQQTAPADGASAAAGGRPPATPQSIQHGQQLFQQTCASCHGAQAKGDGPAAVALNPKPQDLTDDQWKHGGQPPQIFRTISNGVPGTGMVAWTSIPEKDRWDLVNYILSLQKK